METISIGFSVEELEGLGIYGGTSELTIEIQSLEKDVGEEVKEGEVLLVFETEKAAVEKESIASGRISKWFFEAGEEWRPDGGMVTTLFGEILTPALGEIEIKDVHEKDAQEEVVVSEYDNDELDDQERDHLQHGDQANLLHSDSPIDASEEDVSDTSDSIRAVPAARAYARRHDIDLKEVQANGTDGVIQLCDVQKMTSSLGEEKGIIRSRLNEASLNVLKPSREWRTIAKNLEEGPSGVIASGEMIFDLTIIRDLVRDHRDVTQSLFLVRLREWTLFACAVVRVLQRDEFRLLNGYWDNDEINLYPYVNLGISYDRGVKPSLDFDTGIVSGPRLKVLTLHGAEIYSPAEFLVKVESLLLRANMGEVNPKELIGHTFIFNNIGALGHTRGISLLTPHMGAMLNMGAIGEDGKTALQICFDHRLCDGSLTARFLNAVVEEVHNIVLPKNLE